MQATVSRYWMESPNGAIGGFQATRLEAALAWARSRSLHALAFVGACCSPEITPLSAAHGDLARRGFLLPGYSPQRADLLLVGGTLTRRQAPVLQRLYAQMPEPKWVMAFGACACSGGPYDNYATLPGIDHLIPVDIFIPGCPPRPEAVLDGLARLQERVRRGPARRERTRPPV